MAIFSDVYFYDVNPIGLFSTTVSGTTTYTGPATADGVATITDNETGIEGVTLDDDNNGAETATADVTIGALSSTGSNVDGEATWTVQDTVTGEIFHIVAFDVEDGAAAGDYLISEIPLVVGRVYTTLAYNSNPDATAGDPVGSYEDYYVGWGIGNGQVDGTDGDDDIDDTYVDAEGEVIDGGDGTGPSGNQDLVYAGDGNDTVEAGDGDDTVYGGGGNDTIDGGGGDDTIYGDFGPDLTTSTESLNWSTAGADEGDISAGITQTTGEIDVTVSFASDGDNNPLFQVESTDTVYVDTATGEPMSTTSSTYLFGEGPGATSTTTIDFAATAGSDLADEVENVMFRINDIDEIDGNHKDIVTVLAFDGDGNPVDVVITFPSNTNDSYDASTNTITADGNINDTQAQSQGSALVTIAGPVGSIQISYTNAEDTLTGTYTGTHAIWVTDVHFDTMLPEGGDDTIDGGLGADTMYGEGGNDTFAVAEGDVAEGGDGDDTFNLVDLSEAGSSTITIVGGEGDETTGDTLNFGSLIDDLSDITYTETDDTAGGLSGFATLTDGTVVTFSEIETVTVCFAAGTLIDTLEGPKAVESLSPGDVVLTRDAGAQPVEWVGISRTVCGESTAPIRFATGVLGATRDLLVSPQHRMLIEGHMAELLFGEREVFVPAKALVNGTTITSVAMPRVTYVHVMLRQHHILSANGVASESFFPAQSAIRALQKQARQKLMAERPDLAEDLAHYGPTARPCLNVREARLITSLMVNQDRDMCQAA